ncbi:hypothetical protein SCLCIDRAFT_1219039 [Scleroderma citrinum Foug A]|uniref:Uncharacterized protein n=1 Tax=Scleroderma citrinum Foug A TaxID=1036808 RepID=A0A0C2ZZX0_9AGAM|nr:hypothetical protein SCLCIDRAFT_1219039 [Scleroderma citrinum Foug A]
MGSPIADTGRCIRYTTLTCLVCQTLTYRVQQLVPLDVDGQEGPLLPSLDWVEHETLKSLHGWIEVHNSCLVTDAVASLSSSSAYSPIFHVAVPDVTTPVPTPSADRASEEFPDQSQYDPSTGPFLSNLKPLFPPAPFVPPHPVFTHLLSIAESKSNSLRTDAERDISAVVRDKVAELQVAEDELRRDVKCLWMQFVENLGKAEEEKGASSRKKGRGRLPYAATGVSGTPLVSVRNFVASPAERLRSPVSSIPRMSSLSASLATSAFHHPAAQRTQSTATHLSHDSPRSSPPYSSRPSSLGSVNGRSPPSDDESMGPSPRTGTDAIVQPFKRKMDESQDTTVSFRYFSVVEAEASHARQRQAVPERVAGAEEPALRSEKQAETIGDTKDLKSSGGKQTSANEHTASQSRLEQTDAEATKAPPERTTPKSKRRVTFDIKVDPDDANEKNDESSPVEQSRDAEEMIFELEEEGGERDTSEGPPVLSFVDSAPASQRHGRHRSGSHTGLPASLSSLWPTSLPAHSGLRQRTGIANTRANGGSRRSPSPVGRSDEREMDHDEDVDQQEEEILKLVAAHTPSHRGAWKRNSKAWKALMNRHYIRDAHGALVAEENEDDSERTPNDTDESDWDVTQDGRWSAGIPASLPISIGPLVRRREPLSLASYLPKSSLPDWREVAPPSSTTDGRHGSPATLRRASYADRDQNRHLDPGPLDYTAESGDEESDEELGPDDARGRHRALKILEARSKIPVEGMWRSLA